MLLSECAVGQNVFILDGQHDWYSIGNNHEMCEQARTTVILGFRGGQVVVYRPEEIGGYNITTNNGLAINGWLIPPEFLKLLPDLPKPKPYPHKCRLCNAPARKVGTALLCSNNNCKSKYDFKKQYEKPYKKVSSTVNSSRNKIFDLLYSNIVIKKS